jgi:hypothetical protein
MTHERSCAFCTSNEDVLYCCECVGNVCSKCACFHDVDGLPRCSPCYNNVRFYPEYPRVNEYRCRTRGCITFNVFICRFCKEDFEEPRVYCSKCVREITTRSKTANFGCDEHTHRCEECFSNVYSFRCSFKDCTIRMCLKCDKPATFDPNTLVPDQTNPNGIMYCRQHVATCFHCNKWHPQDTTRVIEFRRTRKMCLMCKPCYVARQTFADILLLHRFPKDIVNYILWKFTCELGKKLNKP